MCILTEEKKVKCVVWDLDNTVWNGTLSENDEIIFNESAVNVIKTLDERGILQSIASKNDFKKAMEKLEENNLDDYFLYPQIHWGAKSSSIQKIKESLNIGADSLAFIDDQEYERQEVNFKYPEVVCIDALKIDNLLDMPEMKPRFITEDSKIRRKMYQSDIKRNFIKEKYVGTQDEFLETLGMTFSIAPASEDDLKRAEELTIRTHQLNTTGYTYSYDELNRLRLSDNYQLLVATLDDKFGVYGKIGLCLIETKNTVWTIKLLLMSCRVMSRGVGSVMINYIRNEARKRGVKLLAEFIQTDVNRMMYITYKFANFTEYKIDGDYVVLENDLSKKMKYPDYLKLKIVTLN